MAKGEEAYLQSVQIALDNKKQKLQKPELKTVSFNQAVQELEYGTAEYDKEVARRKAVIEQAKREYAEQCKREVSLTEDEREIARVERLNSQEGELTGYDCAECKNRGYFYVYDGNSIAMSSCRCSKVRASLLRIKASGLASQIANKTFENFACENDLQKRMKQLAQAYLQASDKWLLFAGQSGVGKTHLCTAVCGVLLNSGVEVVYLTYRDCVPQLKRHANDDAEFNAMMDKWKECEVLYIDDFFKGKITDVDINYMFELLDYRSRNTLRTIISTELMPDKLISTDEALGGRIMEKCAGYVVAIPKDSKNNYRNKIATKEVEQDKGNNNNTVISPCKEN